MLLEIGDRLLIAHRRLFPEDQPRFFVGVVEGCEGGCVIASGYSWVRDPFTGGCVRTKDRRSKVVSIMSGAVIVYRLPAHLDVEALRFDHSGDRELVLTDGADFTMDITERAHPVRATSSQVA